MNTKRLVPARIAVRPHVEGVNTHGQGPSMVGKLTGQLMRAHNFPPACSFPLSPCQLYACTQNTSLGKCADSLVIIAVGDNLLSNGGQVKPAKGTQYSWSIKLEGGYF